MGVRHDVAVHRVALTGGIATGKSYVRARLGHRGVPTIDADALARDAVAPGTTGLAAVLDRFGPAVLDSSGQLDRAKLATLVFADDRARFDLEAIVHPAVRRATEQWFGSLDPRHHRFAVADVPLLYEVGRDKDFELVIVAACDPDTQVRRLVARNGLSDAAARLRVRTQLPIADKIARADYVIRTDGTTAGTDEQVDAIVELLNEKWKDQ